MQYDYDYGLDDTPSWGITSPRDGDLGLVRDAVRKEQVIKYIQ